MVTETVFGVLASSARTTRVLAALEAAGFHETDVMVLFPSASAPPANVARARPLPEALARLSPTGATLGGLLGLSVGLLAPFALDAPLMVAALGATVIGAIAGAHAGAGLVHLVAAHRSRQRHGRLLVAVYTESPSSADVAMRILETNEVSDVEHAALGNIA